MTPLQIGDPVRLKDGCGFDRYKIRDGVLLTAPTRDHAIVRIRRNGRIEDWHVGFWEKKA